MIPRSSQKKTTGTVLVFKEIHNGLERDVTCFCENIILLEINLNITFYNVIYSSC